MNLSPSTPLLIHILAVLCLTFSLIQSEDTGLLDAVVASNDAVGDGAKTTVSTVEPTDSTTDSSTDEITTDNETETTTDSEMNTTESIVSTSAFPNLSCVLSLTDKICVLEGTAEKCDPCLDFICDKEKSCLSTNCIPECQCTDELTIEMNGVCTRPCDAKPCLNSGKCVPTAKIPSKFTCNCPPDYDGDTCQNEHNYCNDEQPAKCPKGARSCSFKGVGDYSCGCAKGYVLDTGKNECIKVSERLHVTLTFDTLYKEAYNVDGQPEYKMARDSITKAMNDLYGTLLITISYDNFTQGSLIANFTMGMKIAPNGDPQQNVYDLMTYTTNCATTNTQQKACFGDLGKPFLPKDGAIAEDLRCNDDFCPVGTECVPNDKSEKSVRCSCSPGYRYMNETVVDDTGRQIDMCEDIDQCMEDHPCAGDQVCVNHPGSYECLDSPCKKNPCPGNAVCKTVDQFAYDCECEWIYIASDCGTPWPLILVIVSSVLLALLILAIIGLIILFSRSKKGSSVIASTSF